MGQMAVDSLDCDPSSLVPDSVHRLCGCAGGHLTLNRSRRIPTYDLLPHLNPIPPVSRE